MKLIHTMVLPIVLCMPLLAQESRTTSVGTSGGSALVAKIVSPDIQADGKVTFRLLAPKATEVLLEGNWGDRKGVPMTKDDSGVWSSSLNPP